jgi:prolyl-tRNA synthetase
LEKATSKLAPAQDLPGDEQPQQVHTPGMKTIEEVSKFLGVSPTQKIKTLALMQVENDPKRPAEKGMRPVIALLRGDHSLNEAKLSSVLGGKEFRPMHAEEIENIFNSPAGFLGPVNVPGMTNGGHSAPLLLADLALQGRSEPRRLPP